MNKIKKKSNYLKQSISKRKKMQNNSTNLQQKKSKKTMNLS